MALIKCFVLAVALLGVVLEKLPWSKRKHDLRIPDIEPRITVLPILLAMQIYVWGNPPVLLAADDDRQLCVAAVWRRMESGNRKIQ
jgi:hypothetical protein